MLHQDKDLKNRTKQFTIGIFNFAESLDYSIVKKVEVNQITKSGSSVGANHRSAGRGISDADFPISEMLPISPGTHPSKHRGATVEGAIG
jgi:hypothetical protein